MLGRRRLTLVFLLLIILANFETAFHHHEDGGDHHDCSVCAAACQPATGISFFSLESQQPFIGIEIPYAPFGYDTLEVALLFSRAPPA
jgi:hypothetical protein